MGAVAAIFKMADMNFQCAISRHSIDRKLIIVSLSLLAAYMESKYGNYHWSVGAVAAIFKMVRESITVDGECVDIYIFMVTEAK